MSFVPTTAYSLTASAFHWAVAIPTIASIGAVLKAQSVPKEEKGKWMFRHKSMGLLVGMIVAPRVAYRMLSRSSYNVSKLEGNSSTENVLAKAGHYALYVFMTFMPATGIAMGYYGGNGLPFFYKTIAGAKPTDDETKKSNGGIAKKAFNIHKTMGVYGKYLVPIHAGAAVWHWQRGQNIFYRINPFRKPRA
jgi:superoxide oxidase